MSQLTYNDHSIDQRDDNYVNLTQMAKAKDVRLDNYLRNAETQKYLKAAQESISLKCEGNIELVLIAGFGKDKKTWRHPLVALHFGQWISPEFYVWCNQNIHTLVTTGSVALQETTIELKQALLQTQHQLSQLTNLVTNFVTGAETKVVEPTKRKSLLAETIAHPNPEIKEIPTRRKIRLLVNEYCRERDRNYQNVYRHYYNQYKERYGYDVYARAEELKVKCKLTVLETDNRIDEFYQMVSALAA